MPLPSNLAQSVIPGGQTVNTSAIVAAGVVPGALETRPLPMFFYVFYTRSPQCWHPVTIEPGPGIEDHEVGTWWLPLPQKVYAQPGVAGFKSPKKGQLLSQSHDEALAALRREGALVLDQSHGYCVAHTCVDPHTLTEGTVHLEAWQSPREKVQDRPLGFDFDRQTHYRWLLALVREGVLPAPTKGVIKIRVAGYREAVSRRTSVAAAKLPENAPTAKSFVGEMEDRLHRAEEAGVPQPLPRGEPVSRGETSDYVAPESMSYTDLKAAAKELGWKVGRLKTEDLRQIVLVGLSPEEAEGEGFDVDTGVPYWPEEDEDAPDADTDTDTDPDLDTDTDEGDES